MRKLLNIAVLMTMIMCIALCGCQSAEEDGASGYGENISKVQVMSIVSADTREVVDIIEEKDELDDFIASIDMESWKMASLPEEAVKLGFFGLSQEETIRLGETEPDGILYDVAEITLYEGDYITFETDNMNMTFKVSGKAGRYMKSFFE